MAPKSLLVVGALSLVSLGIASAKSYDIMLASPSMVGTQQLKPGEYRLKVEGSQAVFTDVQSSKTWTAAVKVENSGKKFDQTMVESLTQGDKSNIQAIDLGGSTTRLQFGQ